MNNIIEMLDFIKIKIIFFMKNMIKWLKGQYTVRDKIFAKLTL